MKARLRRLLVGLVLAPATVFAQAISTHEEFLPKSGRGPVVVVITGATGASSYLSYAQRVAELGYYTVLIEGREILTREHGAANLRAAITQAQASPHGAPGKAMLIGFSQGGGGILAHGTAMDDLVVAAVAYYPATSWARNPAAVAARIRVPILIFAGGLDRYNNCCLAETARQIEAAAKERARPLELVVYPHAHHGFNLDRRKYREQDAEDAWRRTAEMLAKHQPVQ
jgi:dienelactone hydrolase